MINLDTFVRDNTKVMLDPLYKRRIRIARAVYPNLIGAHNTTNMVLCFDGGDTFYGISLIDIDDSVQNIVPIDFYRDVWSITSRGITANKHIVESLLSGKSILVPPNGKKKLAFGLTLLTL